MGNRLGDLCSVRRWAYRAGIPAICIRRYNGSIASGSRGNSSLLLRFQARVCRTKRLGDPSSHPRRVRVSERGLKCA